MTWFKVDDAFWRSAKVRKLGNEKVSAAGLWALCGAWSADNLTDGFVPWEVIDPWDTRRRLARNLVRVGLWEEAERDGEPGIVFHDWDDWQPTKEQVTQRRKADAERRARWRAARKAATRDTDVTPDHGTTSPVTSREESRRDSHVTSRQESRTGSVLPDPTRPDPTRISYGDMGRGAPDPTARDSNALPRATPHDPPCEKPCRRCQAARLEAEAAAADAADIAERYRRDEQTRRAACRLCDADGWTWHDPNAHRHGVTNTRCTHQPQLRSVTA